MNQPNNDREQFLESVRVDFEKALQSDCRPVDDLLQWAPSQLPTTDFQRALTLIAEAFVSQPGVVRKVVPLRSTPAPRSWRQSPIATIWGGKPTETLNPRCSVRPKSSGITQ